MRKLLGAALAAILALVTVVAPPALAVEVYRGDTGRTFLGTTNVTDLVVGGTLAVTGDATAGRWTNTVTASNSVAAHRWTDGTVRGDLYLGTSNNLQFGTSTNHTFSILQNNSVRMSFGATAITLGTAMPLRLVETSTGSAPTSYLGGSSSYNSLAFDGNGPILQSSASMVMLIDSNGDTSTAAFRVAKDTQTSNTSTHVWQVSEDGTQLLVNAIKIATGTGSPEGVVTAPVGSTYHRSDGGAGTSFYVKESGAGNTGWVAK